MQFADDALPFLTDDLAIDEAAARKHLKAELRQPLIDLRDALTALPSLDPAATEAELRRIAEQAGVKPAALIHATRVAVTGRAVSPGLFEVIELLGRERVLGRLDRVQASAVWSPDSSTTKG